jgi:hypothetical protein
MQRRTGCGGGRPFLRILDPATAEQLKHFDGSCLLDRDSEISYYLYRIGVGSLDFHHTIS